MSGKERRKKCAADALRAIGVGEGYCVLDCCCGCGNYAVAAAALVGKTGLVYAIDDDNRKLEALRKEADSRGLRNIRVIKENVELGIPMPDGAADVVLLYDIFWYFRPTQSKTMELLKEVRRVAKADGMISVYPTHIDSNSLTYFKKWMEDNGFVFLNECVRQLVHEGILVTGTLLNYGKGGNRNRRASGPGSSRTIELCENPIPIAVDMGAAGITVYAGGNIHAKDSLPAHVDQLNDVSIDSSHLPCEAILP